MLALVAALAGTGLAASKLTKGEKRQVNKLIVKKAPSLSVANADKLDGKDASQLQTASAYAESANNVDLDVLDQDVISTSITTSGTRVIAVATAEAEEQGGGAALGCTISIAGVENSSYYKHVIADATGGTDEALVSLTFARELGPGTHPVALRCSELDGSVQIEDAALSVWAVGS